MAAASTPQTLDDFRRKFRVDELTVFTGHGWAVSLRPQACTLGACVLSATRACRSLGDLNAEEAAGLANAAQHFEAAARAAFGADKFNYLALMMVDDQLHFHALPRYAGEREFAGLAWGDPGWPGQPKLSAVAPADDGRLRAVRDALVAALPA